MLTSDQLNGLELTVGSDVLKDFLIDIIETFLDDDGEIATSVVSMDVPVERDTLAAAGPSFNSGEGDDNLSDDVIKTSASDDSELGGSGYDLFIFGSSAGADYFDGDNGCFDSAQLDDVSSGPAEESGWTFKVEDGGGSTELENSMKIDTGASGVITLLGGLELTFGGVDSIQW